MIVQSRPKFYVAGPVTVASFVMAGRSWYVSVKHLNDDHSVGLQWRTPSRPEKRVMAAMQVSAARASQRTTEVGAFGDRLSSCFGVGNGLTFVKRSLRTAEMAVTEIRADNPEPVVSEAIPAEDAFLAVVLQRDFPDHVSWEDGRPSPVRNFRPGHTMLQNLQRSPTVLMSAPLHSLDFYLPRVTLDTVADEAGAPRIEELRYAPGEPIDDPVMQYLGQSLRGAFEQPEQANRLFLDHVMMAVTMHVATTYGGLKPSTRPVRGGLAGWQERRAKEILAAHLTGQIAMQDVAAACSLSISHFSRAFRKTTGLAPHQWLLLQRVEAAKSAMMKASVPLAEIALACGFADQSHFTRVFSKQVGVSPGCWRRYAEIGPTEADHPKLLTNLPDASEARFRSFQIDRG
jgi:AraC family transcriptional regulator